MGLAPLDSLREKRAGFGGTAAFCQSFAEEESGARKVEMSARESALEAAEPGSQQAFSLGGLAGRPQGGADVGKEYGVELTPRNSRKGFRTAGPRVGDAARPRYFRVRQALPRNKAAGRRKRCVLDLQAHGFVRDVTVADDRVLPSRLIGQLHHHDAERSAHARFVGSIQGE